jgi:hypothetical protein
MEPFKQKKSDADYPSYEKQINKLIGMNRYYMRLSYEHGIEGLWTRIIRNLKMIDALEGEINLKHGTYSDET